MKYRKLRFGLLLVQCKLRWLLKWNTWLFYENKVTGLQHCWGDHHSFYGNADYEYFWKTKDEYQNKRFPFFIAPAWYGNGIPLKTCVGLYWK